MNKIFRNIINASLAAIFFIPLTGCLEEAFPEDDSASKEQLEGADKKGLFSAIPAYMLTCSDDNYCDIGFPGFGIWRDTMTPDFPVKSTTYDYFMEYASLSYMGDWSIQTMFWRRYYYMIQKTSTVLSVSDRNPDGEDAYYVGNALGFRAWAYMDLGRLYEFRPTGVPELDEIAESRGLYGLTVPIVTENTTDAESRRLVRVPFYELNRFIMNDLNEAERCLENHRTAPSKDQMGLGVIYGLKARMWLELGSRFDRHAEDLQQQLSYENDPEAEKYDKLAIANAVDCYRNAAECARKAYSMGYSPLTRSQWYDPVNGFNTPNNSWMWCTIITPDNKLATTYVWQSFVSFMSPEASYGVSSLDFGSYHMIDARLFSGIDDCDWRRDTWIDPDEAGSLNAYDSKYSKTTSYPYKTWKKFEAYAGFKFHPAGGDGSTSTSGNAVSIPFMRVEEMYLIEAEAVARTQGAAAGKTLLENFMNSYRTDGTYSFASTQLEDVIDEIFKQKRIEFWGEGVVAWDFRRLEKAVIKGYPGTNHPETYRYNSYEGYVAPWTNIYIPDRVQNLNSNIKLNPDPSGCLPLWKE